MSIKANECLQYPCVCGNCKGYLEHVGAMTNPTDKLRGVLRQAQIDCDNDKSLSRIDRSIEAIQSANLAVVDLDTHVPVEKTHLYKVAHVLLDRVGQLLEEAGVAHEALTTKEPT